MRNYWIGAIILLALTGATGWYFMNNKTQPAPQIDTTATQPSATPETNTNDSTPSATTGAVKEIIVTGSNFKFVPSEIKVSKGDSVKITFKNSGGFHDLKIPDLNIATKQIQGGAEETIEFVADKVGTFEYFCSVGNHRNMGMKGNLIVE